MKCTILLMLTSLLCVASCAHKAVPGPSASGTGVAADGGQFYFNCIGEKCLVVVQSNPALDAAAAAVGCGVCSNEHIGEAYAVEIITRKK
jgi:hypothetical protein